MTTLLDSDGATLGEVLSRLVHIKPSPLCLFPPGVLYGSSVFGGGCGSSGVIGNGRPNGDSTGTDLYCPFGDSVGADPKVTLLDPLRAAAKVFSSVPLTGGPACDTLCNSNSETCLSGLL
jgi:hypothetical protein